MSIPLQLIERQLFMKFNPIATAMKMRFYIDLYSK